MCASTQRELWLVRHGETAASRGRTLAGWIDVPLTARGKAQAAALRSLFADHSFDSVWSSDLVRAVTTARLAWGEPTRDSRLRELGFGELEGVAYTAMEPRWREALMMFEGFEAPGGESFAQLRGRVLSFVDELPPGRHALFTHGGVVRLLAREVGEDRFVPTGTLLVVDWDGRKLLSTLEGEGTPRNENGDPIERAVGATGRREGAMTRARDEGGMDRRGFLGLAALGGAAALSGACSTEPSWNPTEGFHAPSFDFDEATLADLQGRMERGELTSYRLTEAYLQRIEALDGQGPTLRSIIEVNPEALDTANALDARREAQGSLGPLHGIPILVKDNLDTADRLTTTAGSLALEGSIPPRDSHVVERLRKAGAVILGKANLSEWANFRSTHSVSGWSGRGGQCRNPYALDRNPCGSSSGSAVAVSANLCALAVGTETDGSVVCPSNANGIVGIKPTVGLVSRAGIIPISHTQDTAGPMARTVADAAALLNAMAGVDPRDDATAAAKEHLADYVAALDPAALEGARIGVARALAGFLPSVDRLFEDALAELGRLGAELVDPADVPDLDDLSEAEYEVLLYEFKADLNAYLATLGPDAPVKSLEDLIAFNEAHRDQEMPYFGQEIFRQAQEKGPLTTPAYREALATCRRLSREEGLDRILDEHDLDALVAPTGSPAWTTDLVNGDHFIGGSSTLAAVSGYPSVTVPMGFVFGLPVGLSFMGGAWSEARLLGLAHAFEQATLHRRPPRFLPTADLTTSG
jgi:amidase